MGSCALWLEDTRFPWSRPICKRPQSKKSKSHPFCKRTKSNYFMLRNTLYWHNSTQLPLKSSLASQKDELENMYIRTHQHVYICTHWRLLRTQNRVLGECGAWDARTPGTSATDPSLQCWGQPSPPTPTHEQAVPEAPRLSRPLVPPFRLQRKVRVGLGFLWRCKTRPLKITSLLHCPPFFSSPTKDWNSYLVSDLPAPFGRPCPLLSPYCKPVWPGKSTILGPIFLMSSLYILWQQ